MIITTADLNAFTGNYEDSEEAVAMKTLFIESAQSVVADFLGYDPERHAIVEILSTREGRKLSLSGRNCTVTAFALDGALVPSASYRVGDDFISLKMVVFIMAMRTQRSPTQLDGMHRPCHQPSRAQSLELPH